VFPDGSASYDGSSIDRTNDFGRLAMIILDFEPFSFVSRLLAFPFSKH
jgi:hypothetical protein